MFLFFSVRTDKELALVVNCYAYFTYGKVTSEQALSFISFLISDCYSCFRYNAWLILLVLDEALLPVYVQPQD